MIASRRTDPLDLMGRPVRTVDQDLEWLGGIDSVDAEPLVTPDDRLLMQEPHVELVVAKPELLADDAAVGTGAPAGEVVELGGDPRWRHSDAVQTARLLLSRTWRRTPARSSRNWCRT